MKSASQDRHSRAARLLHRRHENLARGESITPPLIASSVFHLPGATDAPFYYGRADTPVWQEAEAMLAELEAAPTVLFPSGMAAIASIFYSLLGSDMALMIPSDGYYMTRALAADFLQPFDVQIVEVNTVAMVEADFTGIDLVFIETPSNPQLDVIDIAALCERAHQARAKVIADNTTCTALLQQPLDHGVDIVLCSDTKAAAGHSDVLMGHVASRDEALLARIRRWRTTAGAIPGPFEAWLLQRGLQTLDVRLERMCDTALQVADRIRSHEQVLSLRYPGLPDDQAHALASRQMAGFGSLLNLTLSSETAADRFIEHCPYLASATSFGSVHSSAERRARWGDDVPAGFVRLSVGCEPADVLVESLVASLDDLGPVTA